MPPNRRHEFPKIFQSALLTITLLYIVFGASGYVRLRASKLEYRLLRHWAASPTPIFTCSPDAIAWSVNVQTD